MEITVNPMSDERIIEALIELRKIYRNNRKSKYDFALGYALKKFQEPPNQEVALGAYTCCDCYRWDGGYSCPGYPDGVCQRTIEL